MEAGDKVIVGVNRFSSSQAPAVELLRVDPAIEAAQREHLERLRAGRDQSQVSRQLDALAETARGEANVMPAILDCLEVQATLGEIVGRLRLIWGEYRPISTL
jgi:methylmalonyl-CoA mutase N-terminal domain/subunit